MLSFPRLSSFSSFPLTDPVSASLPLFTLLPLVKVLFSVECCVFDIYLSLHRSVLFDFDTQNNTSRIFWTLFFFFYNLGNIFISTLGWVKEGISLHWCHRTCWPRRKPIVLVLFHLRTLRQMLPKCSFIEWMNLWEPALPVSEKSNKLDQRVKATGITVGHFTNPGWAVQRSPWRQLKGNAFW